MRPPFFLTKIQAIMNIFEYTAHRNPQGVAQMVSKYGLTPEQNPQALSVQAANVVAKFRDPALKDLQAIHPDRAMLSPMQETYHPAINNQYSNANACGCSNFSNADGQASKKEVENRISEKSELIITGGLFLMGLALVLKLVK